MRTRFYFTESSHTLHNRPRDFLLENDFDNKIYVLHILSEFLNNNHTNNDRIQKNFITRMVDIRDDDILLCCDIDEINCAEDMPKILEETQKRGFIKILSTLYYYKLNLQRGLKYGWNHSFAITGKELRGKSLYDLRNAAGFQLKTNGRHFSYLMTPEEISYKIKNAGHPEFMKPRFTDVKEIQNRIDHKRDLYDRQDGYGLIQQLQKVEMDDTYPKTILNNLDEWKEWII